MPTRIYKTALIAAAATMAAGCATTAAGLAEGDVKQTIHSDKAPREFAMCISETVSAAQAPRSDGDHHWVLIMDGYSLPIARWDVTPTATGSVAEGRSNRFATRHDGRVRDCA